LSPELREVAEKIPILLARFYDSSFTSLGQVLQALAEVAQSEDFTRFAKRGAGD
jgi:hypothetical protein